jgi:hypothetical protein
MIDMMSIDHACAITDIRILNAVDSMISCGSSHLLLKCGTR